MDLFGSDCSFIENPSLRVCDFITPSCNWDINKIRSLVSQEDVILKILGIPLSQFETEGSFLWGLTSSGQFSTKTATWAAHSIVDFQPPK